MYIILHVQGFWFPPVFHFTAVFPTTTSKWIDSLWVVKTMCPWFRYFNRGIYPMEHRVTSN